MAEHTRLSAERLELIRRFMGESDAPADGRVEPVVVPDVRDPARDAGGRQPGRALRYLDAVRSIRGRLRLTWPLTAVVLGLLIGLLIARSA